MCERSSADLVPDISEPTRPDGTAGRTPVMDGYSETLFDRIEAELRRVRSALGLLVAPA
jgi:hypothetical protein